MDEYDGTHGRLHAALLRAVLGTADMHKVDDAPIPPLEVARLLTDRAIPAVIDVMAVPGGTPVPQVEELAEIAHDAYERAAAESGWQTQQASRVPWSQVPEANREATRASVVAVLNAVGYFDRIV